MIFTSYEVFFTSKFKVCFCLGDHSTGSSPLKVCSSTFLTVIQYVSKPWKFESDPWLEEFFSLWLEFSFYSIVFFPNRLTEVLQNDDGWNNVLSEELLMVGMMHVHESNWWLEWENLNLLNWLDKQIESSGRGHDEWHTNRANKLRQTAKKIPTNLGIRTK